MPQLDPSTYSSQLFWLAITFTVLFLIMWRVALPRVSEILANRQNRMDHDLERAEQLKREAEEVMTAYEAELAASRAAAHEKLRAVQEQAADAAAARNAELESKLAAELAEADRRIAEERQAALANIATIAADLAGAAVERLTGQAADAAAIQRAVADTDGGTA